MGGSSAQPSDIAGKYRPSKAALDASKLIILNMAERDIRDIGSFTERIVKQKRNGTEIERKYSMDLLTTLETELKPIIMENRHDQAKALLKDLKIILTKKGYCLEFHNDLMLFEAFIERTRKDFEKEHVTEQEIWICKKCGNGQYKLLGRERQCTSCFFVENKIIESVDRELVKVQNPEVRTQVRITDYRFAKTKAEFIDCINDLIETSKLHLVTGRIRQELIKTGEKFGVYIPPSPGWKQDLRYKPEMFNLFGFKTPISTAEEYKLLTSLELRKHYHAELKKWHPDTALGISNAVASFWVELCIHVHNVLKNRKLNYEKGSLRAREDPMYLTRSVEEMTQIEDNIEE